MFQLNKGNIRSVCVIGHKKDNLLSQEWKLARRFEGCSEILNSNTKRDRVSVHQLKITFERLNFARKIFLICRKRHPPGFENSNLTFHSFFLYTISTQKIYERDCTRLTCVRFLKYAETVCVLRPHAGTTGQRYCIVIVEDDCLAQTTKHTCTFLDDSEVCNIKTLPAVFFCLAFSLYYLSYSPISK